MSIIEKIFVGDIHHINVQISYQINPIKDMIFTKKMSNILYILIIEIKKNLHKGSLEF